MAKLKQLLKKSKITLKNNWLKLTTKLTGKTVWQLEEGHVIEPAFISNGVQYYRLKDYFNTFSSRGLTALQVYEEWNMRLQKEHLQTFIERFDEIVNIFRSVDNITYIYRCKFFMYLVCNGRVGLVVFTSRPYFLI